LILSLLVVTNMDKTERKSHIYKEALFPGTNKRQWVKSHQSLLKAWLDSSILVHKLLFWIRIELHIKRQK